MKFEGKETRLERWSEAKTRFNKAEWQVEIGV